MYSSPFFSNKESRLLLGDKSQRHKIINDPLLEKYEVFVSKGLERKFGSQIVLESRNLKDRIK